MRIIKLLPSSLLAAVLVSCGASTTQDTASASGEHDSVAAVTPMDNTASADLIHSVYDIFVFAIDADNDEIDHPEKYFTPAALKKLQEAYEFDCDEAPCYAYYALRTEEQDANPESDGSSRITAIEPTGDGWYTVSYSDMGWQGKTRIRIVNGKIDDYERPEQSPTPEAE